VKGYSRGVRGHSRKLALGAVISSAVLSGAVLSCAVLLCGCPNPNNYGTPRTVEPGTASHTISIETVGVAGARGKDFSPTGPSYSVRIGLAPRVDLGIRAANFTSGATDLKWNFYRSKWFDVALAPGGQWLFDRANDVHYIYAHLPVILGINIGYDATIVLIPGFGLQTASRPIQPAPCGDTSLPNTPRPPTCLAGTEMTRLLGGTTPFVRMGIGFNWRLFQNFAVQPELTIMRQLPDYDAWIVNAGLGVSFLNLPKYDEWAGGD
jgi:hypothetical protein